MLYYVKLHKDLRPRRGRQCVVCGRFTHVGVTVKHKFHRVSRVFEDKWVCSENCLRILQEKSMC